MMFPARLASLAALRRFLDRFCSDAGVGNDDCLRANVVLEELFTNTVRHGHRGDSDSPVWLTASTQGGALELTYEDSAPPFNPYGALPEGAPDATLRTRKLGGLGVLLTRNLTRLRDYAYLYGRNRIRLVLNVS
jgi:anti-sigma regulatory factor (Ser/Thr protein kinase)